MSREIRVHIERLVLEGVAVAPGDRALLRASAAAELSKLLTEGGISAGLENGIALPSLRGGTVETSGKDLGTQVGRAVYGGIGKHP